MSSSAANFIQNRTFSITQNRIKCILSYVCECYRLCAIEKTTDPYSISLVRAKSTIPFEDFLKFELIDNYLNVNNHILNAKISRLEEVHFASETQERYIDTDDKEKPDKIDIYVNRIGLQNQWKSKNDNIYLAIECKRIKQLSDTTAYVGDIEKMTNRNYKNVRLPFEGQLAFIENPRLNHTVVSNTINDKLKKSITIKTNKYLILEKLHSKINSTYVSGHLKNFNGKLPFWIYHLLLDYSKMVIS